MCGRLTSSIDRAGRLERGDRLADARLDARLHARDEVLARQPEPLAPQRRGRLVVGRRQVQQARPGPARATTWSRVSSRPATAWSSAAASPASRANGPIWSSELANATIP